jgi:HK97 family phage prohead protease
MQEFQTLELNDFQFSVDADRRTITGLVVPWDGVSTPKSGMRLRFARDSIKAAAAKFVRFFEDHSDKKVRGRAVSMKETDTGLEMTFKVDDGPDGDRVLALAKSGVKTGLSIGTQIFPQDIEPDKENPGGFLVKLANLLEVSLVQEPSFANSRVITVMASKEFGEIMEETTTPAVEETATEPAKVEFTGIPEGYELVRIKNEQEKPVTVEPRSIATVNEPVSYKFDNNGNLQAAKYDFGVDFIQAMNRDLYDPDETPKARQRVQEFINANFDVVTTNVDELNPTRQTGRYVDLRDYRSPVWEAVRKGSVPNGVQPFAWPKYSSSSGLVAEGTEGTEPSSGAYVTTSQTVTPTTLRGKAKISREVWEMGGTPGIGTLIWGQMVRDYQEALEAKIVATLDAATPTSLGSLTAGGGTDKQTLVDELTSYLATLQFVRGGFSMGYLFAQVDLYKALIAAKDDSGRALFSAIGPQNANGTVSSRFGSININGVQVIPTWALAATGSVAASSYLIDPTAVDGWADAPRRLLIDETEVSNVYVGVWGYAATAINDTAGVREVIYDPVA